MNGTAGGRQVTPQGFHKHSALTPGANCVNCGSVSHTSMQYNGITFCRGPGGTP